METCCAPKFPRYALRTRFMMGLLFRLIQGDTWPRSNLHTHTKCEGMIYCSIPAKKRIWSIEVFFPTRVLSGSALNLLWVGLSRWFWKFNFRGSSTLKIIRFTHDTIPTLWGPDPLSSFVKSLARSWFHEVKMRRWWNNTIFSMVIAQNFRWILVHRISLLTKNAWSVCLIGLVIHLMGYYR